MSGALPRVLMASEVALALLLVVSAGLLGESLLRLYKAGVGFDPHGVVNIDFDMDKQRREGSALVQLYQQIGDGLSHQPEVKSVSFALIIPLTGSGWDQPFAAPGGVSREINLDLVGPAYFQTMRIPNLAGRDFRWSDDQASGYKIILNQAAAKLFFPGRNAIGQQIVGPIANDPGGKTSFEVVGVVGNAKYYRLREITGPIAYRAISQGGGRTRSYSAVVRVDGSPGPLAAAARSITARLAPDVPAPVITTMNSVLDDSISAERPMAALSAYFAACAVGNRDRALRDAGLFHRAANQ
jgi:putative ABC transport system permease protein